MLLYPMALRRIIYAAIMRYAQNDRKVKCVAFVPLNFRQLV